MIEKVCQSLARIGVGLRPGCIRYEAGVHPRLRPGPHRLYLFSYLLHELLGKGDDDWEDARLILSRFPELLLVARD